MANKKDAYETLGVTKNASSDEIKQGYRKMAKKYHPDLNHEAGAAEKFKEVQEAYDVLSDENKKQLYDQYGWAGVDPQANGGFGGGQGQSGFQGFGDFGDLGDIFSSFFGGGARQSRNRQTRTRGEDIYSSIKISFMESIKGVTKTIPLSYYRLCSKCNGTGAESPSDIITCSNCRGSGRIRMVQQSLFGQVQTERECPNCNGSGKSIRNRCSRCNGQGYERIKENYDLKIPQGIGNGRQLRLQGKGHPGMLGGECGDLYIEVAVEQSSIFKRDGLDIHIEYPISIIDAALGAYIEVPTVYGIEKISIPAGSQHGDTFKIKGKGVKSVNASNYGDEYIHLVIKVPTSINRQDKEKYEALRQSEIDNKKRPNDDYVSKVKRQYNL